MLNNKKILLGITGGIAAYKCAHLVRLLVKQGAEVKVIITKAATEFITPQTLSVLSKNTVITDFFDANYNWNNHVKLAQWADVFVIAPLTANTLAKMANGLCDSILLATYLSLKTKTIVAPAMDLEMYQHPTTQQNLQKLISFGNLIIPAETGELASGLVGEGRMAEPENIITFLQQYYSRNLPLSGKKALVNAGPTYEAIDPVRYIGNRSSGKMGIAIATKLSLMGAAVTLILGPSAEEITDSSIHVIKVESAEQMLNACLANFNNKNIVVCSAAVADYKPEHINAQKIKKKDETLRLNLIKTVDIVAQLGKQKTTQCLIGFALETENLIAYATDKLRNKNLDIIIANTTSTENTVFGSDTNEITIIDKHNKITNFELNTKHVVASHIVNYIIEFIRPQTQ